MRSSSAGGRGLHVDSEQPRGGSRTRRRAAHVPQRRHQATGSRPYGGGGAPRSRRRRCSSRRLRSMRGSGPGGARVSAQQERLAQQREPEREHLVGEHAREVAQERGERIVLGDHQIAVAELHGPLPVRHVCAFGRAVAPDVMRDRGGLVARTAIRAGVCAMPGLRPRPSRPAPRPSPPPGPRRRRPRPRPRPRARRGGTGPRRRRPRTPRPGCRTRARGGRGPPGCSCAACRGAMPAVSMASRYCSGAGPSVRISLGATEPTPGSSSRRRAASTKPGERKQSGCTNRIASVSTEPHGHVHGAREGVALVQAHAAHAELGGDLAVSSRSRRCRARPRPHLPVPGRPEASGAATRPRWSR